MKNVNSKEEKTNVMRILESRGIEYSSFYCEAEGLSGVEIAEKQGQDPDRVFKTLVTVGKSGEHYVYVIPVKEELNLKKAASVAGEKNIEMIKQKELLPLTGYIHGGCSPIGMKKVFKTFIDEQAELFDDILFSGGKVGCQVEVASNLIIEAFDFIISDLTM